MTADEQDNQETPIRRRKFVNKKQIIDAVTELEDGPGMNIARGRNGNINSQVDVSDIVTIHQFLPRSRSVMRLLEIRQDPLAHFLPTRVTPTGTYYCAGPPGLAPELAEMFMRPVTNILAPKRRERSPDKPNKKPRLENAQDEDDIEQARRAGSVVPSIAVGSEILRRESMLPELDQGLDLGDNTGVAIDDYQFDVDMNVGGASDREMSNRLSTPGIDGETFDETAKSYDNMTCSIALFDERPSQTQGQQEAADHDGKGYSRNTVKALTIIRKDLQPSSSEVEKVMSFQQMSHKVSNILTFEVALFTLYQN